MLPPQSSNFTLQDVTIQIGNALQQQEQDLTLQLQQLQSQPNASEQQLAIFQANLTTWSSLLNMESSIIKTYGDTMKQIVTNMGA
ncbi:MAG: EscF/YscF/HrpA family type III secretion system needle major subunit [Neisseriaceae bacterium]